jgi:protein-tyrosine phosphatase
VYLLGRPRPIGPWPHRLVTWPDFRLPRSTAEARAALDDAYHRAAIERVEIGCSGGVGRTGTGLAVLAVRAGIPADEAVAWVRAHYHRRAVETPWQRRWVRRLGADGPDWSG